MDLCDFYHGLLTRPLFRRSLAAMQQFQTNVFGVLNVTNAILPHMRERQSGTVVIVGSRTGWHAACPVSIHTTCSKWDVD